MTINNKPVRLNVGDLVQLNCNITGDVLYFHNSQVPEPDRERTLIPFGTIGTVAEKGSPLFGDRNILVRFDREYGIRAGTLIKSKELWIKMRHLKKIVCHSRNDKYEQN